MKLKPLAPLLCLFIAVPGLSVAAEKTVYGLNEYARINDPDIQLAAKLDTGAKTASSAPATSSVSSATAKPARFYLATDNADDTPIEKPLARISKISAATATSTDEGKAYTARPVIELQVCMGKAIRTIEVNLTDRSAF
ncbi:ATP-dependent zinc protease [Pseudomonas aeruginosa]